MEQREKVMIILMYGMKGKQANIRAYLVYNPTLRDIPKFEGK